LTETRINTEITETIYAFVLIYLLLVDFAFLCLILRGVLLPCCGVEKSHNTRAHHEKNTTAPMKYVFLLV